MFDVTCRLDWGARHHPKTGIICPLLLTRWAISFRRECRCCYGLFNPDKPCFMVVCENLATELQESKSGVAKSGKLCFSPASLPLGIMMSSWLFKKLPYLHDGDGAMQPSCPLCPPPKCLYQFVSLRMLVSTATPVSALIPRPSRGALSSGTSPVSLPSCLSVSSCTFRPGCSHFPPLLASPLQAAQRIRQPRCPTRQPT